MPKLIATRPFTYATRMLVPGDTFEARPNDARVLLAIKKAREVREPTKIDPPPAEVARRIQQAATASSDGTEDIEKLRADATALGVKVDLRWGSKRIQSEIDKALA